MGGSNSILLQQYCKVLYYFGIAASQSIAINIAKSQSIAILIAKIITKYESIAKSVVWIIVKYESISKSIAKYESIAKGVAKFRAAEFFLSCAILSWISIGNNYFILCI